MNKEYLTEPFCDIRLSVIDAIDALPREEQYPTLKAIIYKKFGFEIEAQKNINYGIFNLAIGYKGVEVEE